MSVVEVVAEVADRRRQKCAHVQVYKRASFTLCYTESKASSSGLSFATNLSSAIADSVDFGHACHVHV